VAKELVFLSAVLENVEDEQVSPSKINKKTFAHLLVTGRDIPLSNERLSNERASSSLTKALLSPKDIPPEVCMKQCVRRCV